MGAKLTETATFDKASIKTLTKSQANKCVQTGSKFKFIFLSFGEDKYNCTTTEVPFTMAFAPIEKMEITPESQKSFSLKGRKLRGTF